MTAKKVLKDREAFEKMKMLSIYFLGLFFQTLFCVLFFFNKAQCDWTIYKISRLDLFY